MECNKDEAARAKLLAEKKYDQHDLAGAKKFLLKALQLFPALEGAPQMLAVIDVEIVAQKRMSAGDMDWYGILQVDHTADEATIRKQYRKLALALHPDKNSCKGAENAFKLVGEANQVLTDKQKRQVFDVKRAAGLRSAGQTRPPVAASNGHHGIPQATNGSSAHDSSTAFWTQCPACKTGFQYLRLYLNLRVECQKCKTFFVARDSDSQQQNFFAWNQRAATTRNGFPAGANAPIFPKPGHASTAAGPKSTSQHGFPRGNATFATAHASTAATGANGTAGTGNQSADVVQQTFEKVKRERVEAEREAIRKDKALEKELKRQMMKEQEDKAAGRDFHKAFVKLDGLTQRKVDDMFKKPLPTRSEPEKKVPKSRKRLRKSSSSEAQDEKNLEKENDPVHEDEQDHAENLDNDEVREMKAGTSLRRSLRSRNRKVAYNFGDTDSEEDNDIVSFLAKKPRLPHETAAGASDKARGLEAQVGDSSTEPPGNGKASVSGDGISVQAQQVTSSRMDGHGILEESTSSKFPTMAQAGKSDWNDPKIEPGNISKAGKGPQKLAERENTESELQEYLLKGERKERKVVHLIDSSEIRESMRCGQAESMGKASDKGKKVSSQPLSDGNAETCLRGNKISGHLQPHQVDNVSPWKGEDTVNDARHTGYANKDYVVSRSRNLRQKEKVSDGKESVDTSVAMKVTKSEGPKTTFPARSVDRSRSVPSFPQNTSRPLPSRSCCPPFSAASDIIVSDPDFHKFDSDRTETELRVGQIWAIYDDHDGMPRFYAKISKVEVSPFRVWMQWLEPHQPSKQTNQWVASTGIALSCGDFRLGKQTTADHVNIFSHSMTVGKGLRNVMKIYPRKQDVWALYQGWDKSWPEEGAKTQYDMVEVVSDFCQDVGVNVAPLIKVPGFTSLFKRKQGVVDKYPPSDLLRFSHKISAYRMAGNEGPGVPKDCWELDTGSIPSDLIDQQVEGGSA